MTPKRDLLRALDAVEPPDQWDDIVARSLADDGHDDLMVPSSTLVRSRRPLAVAAVVLVVVALAAALALGPGRGSDRAGGPNQIWGHRWQLVRVDAAGGAITTNLTGGEGPVVLDLRTPGEFRIAPCNILHGEAHLEGDRFRITEGFSTAGGCLDPLESLIQLDGARASIDGDQLTMTQAKDPTATYTFIRTDALTPAEEFWGRRWRITSGEDASGEPWKEQPEQGPVIDAIDRGRLEIDTCRRVGADARIEGDPGRLALDGTWKTLRTGSCQGRPMDDVIWGVFTHPDTTVSIDGERFAVRSSGGSIRGVMTGLPSQGPTALFGHRWGVALVLEKAEPIDVPRGYVLTAAEGPLGIEVPGCEVRGPASIGADDLVTVDIQPVPEQVHCADAVDPRYKGGLALGEWFREFFAEPVEVTVIGDRALLHRPGRSVALVRLD